jgi:HK97 family phage portal protein
MDLAARLIEQTTRERETRAAVVDALRVGDPEVARAIFGPAWGSTSGAVVNEYTALQDPAVFAAIQNQQVISTMPMRLLQRNEDGTKQPVKGHPFSRVLSRRWNPIHSNIDGFNITIANYGLRGMAFAQKMWNNQGQCIELWPLNPTRVQFRRSPNGRELVFDVTDVNNERKTLPQRDVFYLFGFQLDGGDPRSPIDICREAVGVNLSVAEFMSRFFASGGTLRTALSFPHSIKEPERKILEEALNREWSGTENYHKIAMLPGGPQALTIGTPPDKAQMNEAVRGGVQNTARMFNQPPSRLHEHSNSTLKNIEQQSIEMAQYSTNPLIAHLENALTMQCLSESDQDKGYYIEIDPDGMLRGDSESRHKAYVSGIQNGYYTRNEVRSMENLNPKPGGDDLIVQLNMQSAETIGQEGTDNA